MFRSLIPTLLLASTLVACQGPDDGIARSILTEDEATERADEMLGALEGADYETYTRHFSDAMLSVVDEPTFLEVRAFLTETSGTYEGIDAVEHLDAETPGFTTWAFETTFSKEPVSVSVVYPDDGDVIEGVHFSSANIDALLAEGE